MSAKDIGAKKWWALVAISLAAIAFSLDLTVLNLALPTLSSALHATTDQLQWIADSYALMLAVLTLPAGLIGDRYGRKKVMLLALFVFGVASALCAFSTSVTMLIAARVVLGISAAFILPLALSVLPVFFTDAERPKAIAVLMGGTFIAYPLGPILGGWLLSNYWWGSVFLINIPIVAIALIAVALLLPESKGEHPKKLDSIGILLSSLGLTGVTYGAIQAGPRGWNDGLVISSLIGGLIILGIFVLWERFQMRRGRQPLVDLQLFRRANFTWGVILMTFVNFSMFGLLFGFPQYFQSVRGEDALGSGYHMLPLVGGLMVGALVMGKLARKLPLKMSVAIGFSVMALGLLMGVNTSLSTSDVYLITWVAIIGLGLGFAVPSTANAAISTLSPERSASGNAVVTSIRQVGGTLGVAILGTILGTTYGNQLDLSQLPSKVASVVHNSVVGGVAVANKLHSSSLLEMVRSAFVHGLDVMLTICMGIAVLAVLLAVIFLPGKKEKVAAASVKRSV